MQWVFLNIIITPLDCSNKINSLQHIMQLIYFDYQCIYLVWRQQSATEWIFSALGWINRVWSKTWGVSLILASKAIIWNLFRFNLRTTSTVLKPDLSFAVNNGTVLKERLNDSLKNVIIQQITIEFKGCSIVGEIFQLFSTSSKKNPPLENSTSQNSPSSTSKKKAIF